jgi:hypothetical protein
LAGGLGCSDKVPIHFPWIITGSLSRTVLTVRAELSGKSGIRNIKLFEWRNLDLHITRLTTRLAVNRI